MDRKCFQNTGFGWWNEGQIAETLRTPVGGDSVKANLVLEETSGDLSDSDRDAESWSTSGQL